MQQLLQYGELLLLLLLTLVSLGKWVQKREDGDADGLRTANDAMAKADGVAADLRRHKHTWQEFLNTRYTEMDRTYARKREVELEIQNLRDKIDADCDRITALEETLTSIQAIQRNMRR